MLSRVAFPMCVRYTDAMADAPYYALARNVATYMQYDRFHALTRSSRYERYELCGMPADGAELIHPTPIQRVLICETLRLQS